ncbi:MAG: DUF4870 domain-containing protein [Ignavibacteria bacterium]
MHDQNQNEPAPTSDEKLLAMLAHLSVFLGGIILPIIIWATQKDKSKFVRFHSLQSIFFHIAFIGIIIGFILLFIVILLISGFGLGMFTEADVRGGEGLPVFMIIIMIILYGGIFLIVFGGIGYSIYLALKTYKGNLVKIPVIGKIVYKKVYGQTP